MEAVVQHRVLLHVARFTKGGVNLIANVLLVQETACQSEHNSPKRHRRAEGSSTHRCVLHEDGRARNTLRHLCARETLHHVMREDDRLPQIRLLCVLAREHVDLALIQAKLADIGLSVFRSRERLRPRNQSGPSLIPSRRKYQRLASQGRRFARRAVHHQTHDP